LDREVRAPGSPARVRVVTRGGVQSGDPRQVCDCREDGVRSFGELEAAIMDRIWSAGRPMLVRDVQQALTPERAYNTVLTVVDILYRKGWLVREKDGRAYRYRAVVTREDYTAGLMREVLAASSDRAATLRRFAERIAPDEAEQLREALGQAQRVGERR
jgi:predicted transcriptional regulator